MLKYTRSLVLFVEQNELILDVETSKENIEIVAPEDGYISHSLEEGMTISVGQILFIIDDDKANNQKIRNPQTVCDSCDSKEISEARFSKKALRTATELGVDVSVFESGLVTENDILDYANKKVEHFSERECSENEDNDLAKLPLRPNSIVILGGGGHAKMCIDILRQRKEYEIIGIVDSVIPVNTRICGVNVIGSDSILKDLYNQGVKYAVNGIGSVSNPPVRKKLFLKLKDIGFIVPNLIHPKAVVEPSVTMGEGNQIMMGVCVGSDAQIGDNCIINSGSIVSHDSKLLNHCHIAPGSILAGQVEIGELTVVGMGVTIYIGRKIGANTIIRNGVNIFKDVKSDSVVTK